MKIITTQTCTVVLDKVNNRVSKVYNPYWIAKRPWSIKNEIRALSRLEGKHFPKLISYDENSVVMEYAGESSTASNHIKQNPYSDCDVRDFAEIPEDFEEQVSEILDELEKAKLQHSDINFTHFLIKKGVVMLIDFELCLEIGEPQPKFYTQTAGVDAKVRNIDEPINDRLMAKRTIEYLNGGISKIYRLLGKLKNRKQYHGLPFKLEQKVDRGYLQERIKLLTSAYDFKEKKGIDLGCNIGGLTFALAMKGSMMTGVDMVPLNIEIANACEDYYCLNTNFIETEISDYVLESDFRKEHYDFCVFLATWHWLLLKHGLKRATQVLKEISKNCDVMFFETNFGIEKDLKGSGEIMPKIGLDSKEKLIEFIIENTDYNNVEEIGKCIGWGNRPTFLCSK